MTNLRVIIVGPVTVGILVLFLVIERLRPAQRRRFFAAWLSTGCPVTLLNATLVVPLVVALSLSFAEWSASHFRGSSCRVTSFLPRWLVIALIFVAMDACNWSAHLANHKVRLLWRFHELHHSQEDMSVLTVFRTHP